MIIREMQNTTIAVVGKGTPFKIMENDEVRRIRGMVILCFMSTMSSTTP